MVAVLQPAGLTPEQLAARRKGIGGSDAAAVIGADPWRNALAVYRDKVGEAEPVPITNDMKRGTVLEPIARRLYSELTGRRVRRHGQLQHASYPWMLCNVDGEIVGKHEHQGPGILELKCPGIWAFAKAKRSGLPVYWIVQMQHNLEVADREWGSFALFNADRWELVFFDVERDRDFAETLIVAERAFWKDHVELRLAPADTPPQLLAQVQEMMQRAEAAGELIVRGDPAWCDAAGMYLEAKELEQTAENLKASAEEKLRELMATYGAVEGGGARVYWRQQDGRVTFDKKLLATASPIDRAKLFASLSEMPWPPVSITYLVEWLQGRDLALDLAAFEKKGKPFDTFRVYRVGVGVGD